MMKKDRKEIMPNQNQTVEVPASLGDIMGVGAYEMESIVLELASAQGMLNRGSVLSIAGGKLSLTTVGNESAAYGILLEPSVDTTDAYSNGVVTGSVARSGSFRGEALIVGVGTDTAKVVDALRVLGIYVDGLIIAPSA